MRFLFSFRHMEVSPALQGYAEAKFRSTIEKFVTKPIEAHVTFTSDRHQHTVHVSLLGGDGFSLQVDHSCGDMYGSVDRIVDKLAAQLKRKKDILKDHKQKGIKGLVMDAPEEEKGSIDAADIIKFEAARRRA